MTRPGRRPGHSSGPPKGNGPGGCTAIDGWAGVVMDRLGRGVLLLDAQGGVVAGNALGRQWLEASDGIALRDGRFGFDDPEADGALMSLFAANQIEPDAPRPGLGVRVRRRSGPAHRVVISPVRDRLDGRSVAYVVLVFAPNGRGGISEDVLRRIYGLTRAQAEVAARLYQGLSVDQTAAALGLSLNTVRSHLKQIFSRCEVQSQVELMQLLALGPTAL